MEHLVGYKCAKILYQFKSLSISLQEILFHVVLEALGGTTLNSVFVWSTAQILCKRRKS